MPKYIVQSQSRPNKKHYVIVSYKDHKACKCSCEHFTYNSKVTVCKHFAPAEYQHARKLYIQTKNQAIEVGLCSSSTLFRDLFETRKKASGLPRTLELIADLNKEGAA